MRYIYKYSGDFCSSAFDYLFLQARDWPIRPASAEGPTHTSSSLLPMEPSPGVELPRPQVLLTTFSRSSSRMVPYPVVTSAGGLRVVAIGEFYFCRKPKCVRADIVQFVYSSKSNVFFCKCVCLTFLQLCPLLNLYKL